MIALTILLPVLLLVHTFPLWPPTQRTLSQSIVASHRFLQSTHCCQPPANSYAQDKQDTVVGFATWSCVEWKKLLQMMMMMTKMMGEEQGKDL